MPSIQPAHPAQWPIALDILLSYDGDDRGSNAQFLLELVQSGDIDPRGLLVATDGDTVTGAILCQKMPGNIAALWPPRCRVEHDESTTSALIQAALKWLAEQNVKLVQALLRTQDSHGQQTLEAGGFLRAADLLYLAWIVDQVTPVSLNDGELAFLPYSAQLHHRFAEVVHGTYENTMDCPALNGRRNIEEVLTGYRATGEFAPERWLLVQHHQIDVGCLLLTDHPRTNQWELMYMGLTAAARGKGWGEVLVQRAQRMTATAGRHALSLAVDSNNTPALRVYRGCGFFVLDGRRAMLYEMPGSGHSRAADTSAQ